MSDQPDTGSVPELTPEQESQVRRLLADARHDDPIPVEVAARLDTVLAGLTRDEPGSEGVAPVIDLAARRRRRNAAALLAGAAAVIVAGFAIGQVIDVSPDASSDAGSAAVNTDREGSATAEPPAAASSQDAAGGSGSGTGGFTAPPSVPAPLETLGGSVQLRSSHLESDVTRQLPGLTADAGADRRPDAKAFSAAGCPLTAPVSSFGAGVLYPAVFDGSPAVLALRPPSGDTQRADVLSCDTAASLASVTITRP
jgi:hypothetical protein